MTPLARKGGEFDGQAHEHCPLWEAGLAKEKGNAVT